MNSVGIEMTIKDNTNIDNTNCTYPSNFGENGDYFGLENAMQSIRSDLHIDTADNPGFTESLTAISVVISDEIPGGPDMGNTVQNDPEYASPYENVSNHSHDSAPKRTSTSLKQKRIEYLLNTIGYVVGFGSIWKFSSLCFFYGGGVFLPIYTLFYIVIGLPILLLEMYVGQFTTRGCIECWGNCRILKAVGIGSVSITLAVMFSYVMNMIWAVKYLVLSMFNPVPWSNVSVQASCNRNCSYSADIYFRSDGFHTNLSTGIGNLGLPQWEIILAAIFIWLILFLSLIRGLTLSGKVIYITVLFPYLSALILLIHGISLPGSSQGLADYMSTENMNTYIGSNALWSDAAVQVLFKLSLAQGGHACLSSLNDLKGNVLMNAVIVVVTDYFTSILFGLVVFSYVGYVKYGLKLPILIGNSGKWDGVTLLFIVVPQAISNSNIANLWAILFFLLLIALPFDVMLTLIRTVGIAIHEGIPKKLDHKELYINIGICTCGFISSIAQCTAGGLYLTTLIDHYGSTWTLILIAFLEVALMVILYGGLEITIDIAFILNKETKTLKFWNYGKFFFVACWYCVTPILLIYLLISKLIRVQDPFFVLNQGYPPWANAFGWLISLCTPVSIIVAWIVYFIKAKGSFIQRLIYMRNSKRDEPLWRIVTDIEMNKLTNMKRNLKERRDDN